MAPRLPPLVENAPIPRGVLLWFGLFVPVNLRLPSHRPLALVTDLCASNLSQRQSQVPSARLDGASGSNVKKVCARGASSGRQMTGLWARHAIIATQVRTVFLAACVGAESVLQRPSASNAENLRSPE